jgi:hypothetical protein
MSRGADGRVHGTPAASSRLGQRSSRGEARPPAKELWAALMASSNRFLTMLQVFHLVVAKSDLDVAMFVKLDLRVAYVIFE